MDMGVEGKTALVCGSTSGLGRATAEALSQEGARVVVCGRRKSLAESVAAGLPNAIAVGIDLSAPKGVSTLIAEAETAFGSVDILVLNGPGPRPAKVTEIEEEEVGDAIEYLVTAHHRLISLALPYMRKQKWGRILAIGSSSVVTPIGDLALSSIGRSAFAAYLKMLATEVAADGVTVNMLLPGRIATDRVLQLDAARAARTGRKEGEVKAASITEIPAHRYGDPSEFADVAAFLCGSRASYITGNTVRCDGGLSPVL
ncbi:SDR family oxidoreductase [Streptomyces oceani]|uniref:SDR family oxidoreductase n=1 Tax=Streptomyces oceani TaxID=1075402 RepID=UPI0009A0B591|nr:SDR family oxidoreductase [Streptomyces oceani]